MKRSFFSLSLLTGWLVILLAGCQSPMAGDMLPSFHGQTLTTSLSVTPPVDSRQTKSSYVGLDDAVRNWNLFVFENGVLQAKYYQDSDGDLSLDIMTDRPYCYFALANVGDLTGRFAVGTTTIDDMTALRINVDIENGLPMAWNSMGAIAFSRRQLAAGQKLPVALTRLVGRYDIVVDQSGLLGWSFTATRLTLCGVSDVAPFAGRSRASAASVVTDEATAADLVALNAGNASSYYPVENCLGTLLPEGGSPWNKIPANIPSNAFPSFIEIAGILRTTDGSQLERPVTYRFCLGENASDNFDVVRNQTHTVTLQLSDALASGDDTHWKMETGSYTDTRSLAFTHAVIQLEAGRSVEEAIVRAPAGLKYIIEADAGLVLDGVSVQGHTWGSVCDGDGLTLTAPDDASQQTGTIRLKTLDGRKTASARLDVIAHHYTYVLYVQPGPISLSWNQTRRFYACLYRYDNGVLDTSFGMEGSIDVSDEAEWEISDELLAVASWNAGTFELTANNTTASEVVGRVWATYEGHANYSRVTIYPRENVTPDPPALSVSPAALSWTASEMGMASARTLSITSNTDWTIGGSGDYWSVVPDHGTGNGTVLVYPNAANGTTSDIVAQLSVSGTGVSTRTVTLTHKGQSAPSPVTMQYKVVTTLEDASIQVGGSTTASAVLYASTDGGNSYPMLVSTSAASFSNEAAGSHVTISGSTVTGASAGSARIRGHFEGYSVEEYVDASLNVVAAPVSKYLNASPMNLSWAWDAYGSAQGGRISVSSNTEWTVKQCSSGFGWSKDATSVTVWPLTDNDSFSDDKTGGLVLGGDGVSDVTINLTQGKRSRQLTGIQFNQASYDLVRIVSGSLCYWQSFSVMAQYDDGSSSDVTHLAQYTDQGNLSVNASGGRLTATAASNGRTLTATWQGFSASASYTAEELECPESLTIGRLESQDDKNRMFVLGDVTITLTKAFAGTIQREESTTVTCTCSSNIVFEQYEAGSGWQFYFTASGNGSVSFSYTLNGKTVSATIKLICDYNGKIRKK